MENNNETLEMINSLKFRLNQPAFILLTVFLPFGTIANLLTLFIFWWRVAKSNLRIFILFLTLYDLICCLLGVPLAMVDLFFPVMYPFGSLCKMQLFILDFCIISCLFTLLLISIDRYKGVCRPTKPQLNRFQVKKLNLAIIGISLFLALPISLAADTISYELHNTVNGYICWFVFPIYWDIYVWTIFFMFWVLLIIIFTLYCFVWRSTSKSKGEDGQQIEQQGEGLQAETVNAQQLRARKINHTLLGISVLCAVSLSPYMILNIVYWPADSPSWQTFKLFLIHLWVTNCTGKPVIYVVFDERFRQNFKDIFRQRKIDDNPEFSGTKESEE